MYLLRKLREFEIDSTLLTLFYRYAVKSVIVFRITARDDNSLNKDRERLDRVIKRAQRTCSNHSLSLFDDLLNTALTKKVKRLSEDPLITQLRFSDRSGRVLLPKCRTECYRRSILPSVARHLNEQLLSYIRI